MSSERRRFFRIDETVGISWQVLDGAEAHQAPPVDVLELVSSQDQKIQQLLAELEDENPKVAELISVFNQKLERVVGQLMLDNNLVNRIANKVKQANISACGIGFSHEDALPLGTSLRLELTLFPSQRRISTDGRIVACDLNEDEHYYWRIDFYGMSKSDQEELIQHIVRTQSQQLKVIRQD